MFGILDARSHAVQDKSALVHVDVRIGPFTVVLAGVRIEEVPCV